MHLSSNKNTNFYYFISRNMILIELKITDFHGKKCRFWKVRTRRLILLLKKYFKKINII